MDIVKDVLRDVFGPGLGRALEYNLNRLGSRFEDCVDNPEAFLRALERMLGTTMTRLLERRLVSEVVDRMGIKGVDASGLVELIEKIRRLETKS